MAPHTFKNFHIERAIFVDLTQPTNIRFGQGVENPINKVKYYKSYWERLP